jgi:hypothetical protein
MDWDAVEPLIKQHLGDLKIPVIVYERYEKCAKAQEKLS